MSFNFDRIEFETVTLGIIGIYFESSTFSALIDSSQGDNHGQINMLLSDTSCTDSSLEADDSEKCDTPDILNGVVDTAK